MKVIHVSGTKVSTIIVVITMTTILKQTKCAVLVAEDTIPLVNIEKRKIKKHRESNTFNFKLAQLILIHD